MVSGRPLRPARFLGKRMIARLSRSYAAAAAGSGSYSTTFSGTENPVSESSSWVLGGVTALDWNNFQSSGGNAYAAGFSPGYDDAVMCVNTSKGISSTSHYSEGTLVWPAGYNPADTHELQIHTACTITTNSVLTYEFLIGSGWVRWNGPVGDWTIQGASDSNASSGKGWTDSLIVNNGYAIADGDVFKVTYLYNGTEVTLTAYRNGSIIQQVKDTTAWKLTSGQPGLGAFVRSAPAGDAVLSSRAFSFFTGATV